MTYEKVELKIDGMECTSCEVLLERKFKKIHGVNSVNVNHTKGKATLICTKVPSIDELKNAINDSKYTISLEKEQKSKEDTNITINRDHIEIGAIFLIILALYFIFRQYGQKYRRAQKLGGGLALSFQRSRKFGIGLFILV